MLENRQNILIYEKEISLTVTSYKKLIPKTIYQHVTTLSLLLPNVEIRETKNGEEAVKIAWE